MMAVVVERYEYTPYGERTIFGRDWLATDAGSATSRGDLLGVLMGHRLSPPTTRRKSCQERALQFSTGQA